MFDDDLIDLVQESVVVRRANDGKIVRWNRASERLYGITAADAVGTRLCHLVCNEPDSSVLNDAFAALAATGRWSGELRRKSAAGIPLVVDAQWVTRTGVDGNREVVECAIDMTERRATETRLQYSEYRYRNLFSAMAAAFWELDFTGLRTILRRLRKQGIEDITLHLATHPEVVREMMRAAHVIEVNEEAVALFGGGKREALFESIEAFWPDESTADFAAGVVAGAAQRKSFSTETTLRRLDGTTFDALFTASFPPAVFEKGIFIIGFIDITERKRAEDELRRNEQRYRRLFDLMPVPLVQLDTRGLMARYEEAGRSGVKDLATWIEKADIASLARGLVCRGANRQAVALFGATKEAEICGPVEWVWQLSPETLRRSLLARLRGEASLSEETRIAALDGHAIDVLVSFTYPPQLEEQGLNVVAFVDIRDRVRAQAKIAEMQSDYTHAARVATLGEMAASIAHEVLQPLSAIRTTAATVERWLAREPPELEEARTAAARLGRDARRAAEVVGRVRALATKGITAHTSLDIAPIVEEAIGFLGPDIQRNGVEVVLDLVPGLGVVGNRVELQQVIVNLGLNAVQAMQSSSRRVLHVRSELVVEDAVRVSVEDTGPGISPTEASMLFTSFYTTKKSGLGIGLRICRSILEAHDGTITGAPGPHGGAVFTFVLPRAPS